MGFGKYGCVFPFTQFVVVCADSYQLGDVCFVQKRG